MNRNLTTSAIVLLGRRWGDLHRSITLYSKDLGLIHALAYGARKGKLAGKIEQFLSGVFYLYHNPVKNDYSIIDVEIQTTGERIRNDLTRTYAASFMAELVMRMEGGDRQSVHALLQQAYALLDANESIDRIIIQFIWRFIAISGLQGDLASCPICEKHYSEEEILFFNTVIHAPCCGDCSDVDNDSFQLALGPGARKYLMFTSDMDFYGAVAITLNEPTARRIKRYMLRYASIVAGGDLKTLAVVME